MEKYINLSVHQLVDFLLRTGSIDNRVFNRSSMNEGSKIHSSYQSQQSENYYSEYPLKTLITIDEISIVLEGRADGIIKNKDSYLIDEIKTTVIDLDVFHEENKEWHLGQSKCYAYMFCKEQKLDSIGIKLTYIRQGKEKEKRVKYFDFTYQELENYVIDLLSRYLDFYNIIFRQNEKRNESASKLEFPFSNYRPGQKEIIKNVYSTIQNGGVLFCEAPTGIGKTMSTLYPSIKNFSNNDDQKIFYLTAKSSGKENAFKAMEILKNNGFIGKQIVVTAKDKICFCKGHACNPDECPYAKGYYNKIQTILNYSLLSFSSFDCKTIESIAYENQVCPFELELDLSLFCDVIICDYNYLFHPISYMKRYFDERSNDYIALIDETHNLVDRSREMFSSSLSYKIFLNARKSVSKTKVSKLKNTLSKVNKMFKDILENNESGITTLEILPPEVYKTLNNFYNAMQDLTKNYSKDISSQLMDFSLDVNQFLKIAELINEKYLLYYEIDNSNVQINIFCRDASIFIRNKIKTIKCGIFFSATLSPLKYYMDTLGGSFKEDKSIVLPSPFNRNNLKILIAPKVSIKYKNRNLTYGIVKEYIEKFISGKIGNYFVYVPSYEYLTNLTYLFESNEYDIYVQEKDMSEKDKEIFLNNFQSSPTKTQLGFVVIGGAFSEGIDLVSDRLIGAIIVGIGLPKINYRSDKIKEYFEENDLPGYSYAYLNPAINKVMQAIGRVIRSETDRGAVLLIDERYMNNDYKNLFKEEWRDYEVVYTPSEVQEEIKNFFDK